MKRLYCALTLLLAAVTNPASAELAQPPAVPAALLQALPERSAAVAAIEAHPLVARARAEKAAAHARADGRQRGPHDWIASGQWQQRDAGHGQRFGEWELSVERGVRLPAKARLDRRMAELEIAAGTDALADARHAAASGLLQAWIEWLSASALASQAQAAAAIADEDLQATARRWQAGHASAAEHDAASASQATAHRQLEDARLAVQEASLGLSLGYPHLPLPASAPLIAAPVHPPTDWEAWATRAVSVSHGISLAETRARLAELRAQRARLERRADPSIGMRTMSERGGEENILGVFVSVPLGAGPRQAIADEEAAMAAALRADADVEQLQATLQARTLARRVALHTTAWELADSAARAQAREAGRMARGHALDGVDLVDLLAARRRAGEAAMAEIQARSAAFASTAGLLLQAHAYWLDDPAHAGNNHTTPDPG